MQALFIGLFLLGGVEGMLFTKSWKSVWLDLSEGVRGGRQGEAAGNGQGLCEGLCGTPGGGGLPRTIDVSRGG